MPTGYTAPLYDGKEIDFETFVLRCARAFGAAVLLRDHDSDVLPTEENVIESEGYIEGRLAEAAETLRVFDGISDDDLARLTEEHNQKTKDSLTEALSKNARIRDAYEDMLAKVREWNPPEQYHSLRGFIIDQLESSLHHDVDEEDRIAQWYQTYTPEEYRLTKVKQASRDITHYTDELEKKRNRNAERVEYVRGLYEALGLGVGA